MARQLRTADSRLEAPHITWHGFHTLEERETIIREAAYYRYLKHGCCDGHDIEDWLEAESVIEHGVSEATPVQTELKPQQSSMHGASSDDKLKRALKQHPRKAIPQVESVEPADAPDRQ